MFACIALVGCLRDPQFRGASDGGTDADTDASTEPPLPEVRAEMSGMGARVFGPHYRMRFNVDADAMGEPPEIRMPDSLTIEGVEVLENEQANCAHEDLVGLAQFPGPPISAQSKLAGVTSSTATIDLPGPAVARVTVQFDAALDCMAGTSQRTGSSQFTFFPDGKIVRLDRFVGAAGALTQPCACNLTSAAFIHTSFWTFERADFPSPLTRNNGPDIAVTAGSINNFERACIRGPRRQLAVAYPDTMTRISIPPAGENFAFVYQFPNVPAGDPFDFVAASALFVSNSMSDDCTQPMERAERFRDPRTLLVDGQGKREFSDTGVYSDTATTGVPVIAANGVTLAAAGDPLPFGFAVWLDFDLDVAGLALTRTPALAEPWFTVQQVAPDEWMIFFTQGLAEGEQIQIAVAP